MNQLILPLIGASFIGLMGDVLCKFAAKATVPRDALICTLGASLAWASCAFIWSGVYKSRSILEMLVIFTPCHSVALGLAGVLIFGEVFTVKLVIGAILSAAAVWVMS